MTVQCVHSYSAIQSWVVQYIRLFPLELTIAFLETGRGLYIVYVFTSDCPQFFSTYINIVQ